jgi:hypothetical protein
MSNRRSIMRARHAFTMIGLFVIVVLYFAFGGKHPSPIYTALLIVFGFALFFERCRNCGGVIWLRKDHFLINRFIGPFYLPGKCGSCGSPDFEHAPDNTTGGL